MLVTIEVLSVRGGPEARKRQTEASRRWIHGTDVCNRHKIAQHRKTCDQSTRTERSELGAELGAGGGSSRCELVEFLALLSKDGEREEGTVEVATDTQTLHAWECLAQHEKRSKNASR